MPSTNTWSAPGFPGSGGLSSPEASGRERTWNNTPNFGALPKDQKPVNGYQDKQYRVRQNLYTASLTTYGGSGSIPSTSVVYSGYDPNGLLCSLCESRSDSRLNLTSVIETTLNNATVKALVKMADAKVNVAVAYAEASKTSDLILDTARRIDRAYRAFRKGDLRGIAQNLNITPKRLHKSWLEYKYGWMPLLMDVKGAAEFFAQQHVIRPPRFNVSASELFAKNDHWQEAFEPYGGGSPAMQQHSTSCVVKVKVKIWCELSSPHLSEMQQLGLTNPALVAWELVPFSFVFDWFISVGDWLTAMTAQQGVTITRKMFSFEDSRGYTFNRPGTFTRDTAYGYGATSISWEASVRRYVRSIPDLNPFSLYPPVTNSFNFPKLVTSLALIQGNYRGTSRTSRI